MHPDLQRPSQGEPRYAWVITIDKVTDTDTFPGERSDVGVIGPRGAKLTKLEIVRHPDAHKFRMFDDDGNHYYTGFIVVSGYAGNDPSLGEEFFAPLEDFGTPNAGAVRIDYLNPVSKVWETL